MDIDKIDVIFCDVDGVLTDGSIIYSETGSELKIFNVKDGIAVKQLQQLGIRLIVISGRDSNALRLRLSELGVFQYYLGVSDKVELVSSLLSSDEFKGFVSCAIGDDLNDYGLVGLVNYFFCPKDASAAIRDLDDVLVLNSRGGRGVLREFTDLILARRGVNVFYGFI